MTDSLQPKSGITRQGVKRTSPKKAPPVWAAPEPATLTLQNHPLVRRHYRVATAAIEQFVDLVEHCIRVLVPGALIHARPRMGKTHAIDYVALHLARHRPDILVLRMSCEHHRSDFEGPFFSTLLSAAGVRHPQPKSVTGKRFALMCRLSEQLQMRSVTSSCCCATKPSVCPSTPWSGCVTFTTSWRTMACAC